MIPQAEKFNKRALRREEAQKKEAEQARVSDDQVLAEGNPIIISLPSPDFRVHTLLTRFP